jgi:hypothetical protein
VAVREWRIEVRVQPHPLQRPPRRDRHRHSILDGDCSRVGVGVVRKHGMYWVTLILA